MKKKIFSILFTLVLAISLMVPAGAALAAEPIESQIAEVIFLQGTDYEMGYQYGQQRADLTKSTTTLTEAKLNALRAYQYYLQQRTPEIILQLVGMADGLTDATSETWTYRDCLVRLVGTTTFETGFPPEAEDAEFPPDECSAWAATGSATTDGTTIASGSRDGSIGSGSRFVTVVFPDTGNNYIVTGWPGINGMNNKGVSIFMSGGARGLPDGYGLEDGCEHSHLLRFNNTAEEIVDELMADWLPIHSHGTNRLVADIWGDLYVVEICHDKVAVREAGDFDEVDFIYNSNNWFIEEMALYEPNPWEGDDEFIEHGGWVGKYDSAIARALGEWDMLHNYQGSIDLEFAKMTWQHAGIPPDGTGDGVSEIKPINEIGYWGQICNQLNGSVVITKADDGNNGEWYYSTGTAGWVAYPLGGDRTFALDSTHSWFKLVLGSSPSRVVRTAMDTVHKTWTPTFDGSRLSAAYFELMKLDYHDTAFVALHDLFNLALSEYREGNDWRSEAGQADGNEQLYLYSKAATSYVRAQCHANEVYRALVPPATNPEDLGLDTYGGPWGDWAQPSWSFDLPGERKAKGQDKD